ncbi:hypothetical protein ACEQPO_08100 [Bacillus sp. SL00103]
MIWSLSKKLLPGKIVKELNQWHLKLLVAEKSWKYVSGCIGYRRERRTGGINWVLERSV